MGGVQAAGATGGAWQYIHLPVLIVRLPTRYTVRREQFPIKLEEIMQFQVMANIIVYD
jgi:hypothetical protein